MAENTKIEWATHTFNPWMGCTKVSPACKNCYAERDMDHRYGKVAWGPNGSRVMTSDQNWRKPLKWNKELAPHERRPRVFCASLADVFEDWKGPIENHRGQRLFTINGEEFFTEGEYPGCRPATIDDVRCNLFRLISATRNLDWLLLTKRPENIRRMWPSVFGDAARANFADHALPGHPRLYRGNVWLGTSVENQEQADKRIPELLKCRDLSPVLFLSCEPLLGPVEFSNVTKRADAIQQLGKKALNGIDWVIAGGESGPNARPSHPAWFRSLRDQCQAAEVPFLFKQWGEWGPDWAWAKAEIVDPVTGDHYYPGKNFCPKGLPVQGSNTMFRVGKKAAGRLLDGREWNEFPEVRS